MSDACPEWRGPIAAYVLGQSDDADRVAIEAHLEGCPACRAELDNLRMPVRALAAADDMRVGDPAASAPARLGPAIFGRIGAERVQRARRRQRRAVFAGLGAAAAVVVVAGSLALIRPGTSPSGAHVSLSASPGAVADAVVEARPWGTQVTLTAQGLDPGEVLTVWLETAAGRRSPAGTFTSLANRRVRVILAAATRPDLAVALGVSNPTGTTIARAQLR